MKDDIAAAATGRDAGRRPGPAPGAFIIDDDPLMADLLSRRLDRRGIAARVFDDGERLLAELAERPPAVLFSDLRMPGMGGAQVISRARDAAFTGLVVLVTASRDQAAIAEALRGGADIVLAKPPREYDLDWLAVKARLGNPQPDPVRALVAALEHVDQGAILLDEECVPLGVNGRARRMLGVDDAGEAVKTLDRLGILSRIMDGRHGDIVFVESPESALGGRYPLGVEVREIGDGGSRRLRIVLLHDFTERRRLDDLQAQFAAYLSHRMRTPLTSVRNAVSILCGAEAPLDSAERERFLDIGCRNIERLVSSLEDLQKAFMAESGESSGCRALVHLDRDVDAVLAEAERSGVISGYRLHAPETTAVLSRARLGEFLRTASAAMAGRLDSSPQVECVIAVHGDCGELAGREPEISIVLTSRARGAASVYSLEQYIETRGGEAKIALERLARSLGGTISFPGREMIRIGIPAEPRFDRDLDLVQPLHIMLERARLSSAEFNLVSIRATNAREGDRPLSRMIADSLQGLFAGEETIVAQGESALSFTLFTSGVSRPRIGEKLEELRARIVRSCRERGEEMFPALRWVVAYHCDAVAGECPFVESLLPL